MSLATNLAVVLSILTDLFKYSTLISRSPIFQLSEPIRLILYGIKTSLAFISKIPKWSPTDRMYNTPFDFIYCIKPVSIFIVNILTPVPCKALHNANAILSIFVLVKLSVTVAASLTLPSRI